MTLFKTLLIVSILFLVLPSPIKALMVVILIVAYIVYVINKKRKTKYDPTPTF